MLVYRRAVGPEEEWLLGFQVSSIGQLAGERRMGFAHPHFSVHAPASCQSTAAGPEIVIPKRILKGIGLLQARLKRREAGVIDDRAGGLPPSCRRFRQFDPTAAAAKAGFVRQFPRLRQFPHPHECEVNAA